MQDPDDVPLALLAPLAKSESEVKRETAAKAVATQKPRSAVDVDEVVPQVRRQSKNKDKSALAEADVLSALVEPEEEPLFTSMWQVSTKEGINLLELVSGSARLSEAAAAQGLLVGQPVDLRTGFDLNTGWPT